MSRQTSLERQKIGIGCNGRVGTLLLEIVKEREREIDSEEDRQTEIQRDKKDRDTDRRTY